MADGNMTSEQARDLFSDAVEGELAGSRRTAFDEAVASDPELRGEWEAFQLVMKGSAQLGAREVGAPNLLPKIQSRLRRRFRGRYLRGRSGLPRTLLPLMIVVLVLICVAVAWVSIQSLLLVMDSSR